MPSTANLMTSSANSSAPAIERLTRLARSLPVQSACDQNRHERRVLIGVVWLAALVFTCGLTLSDPDLWGHTLYGLRAIEQGVLTERTDPFSYTAIEAPWVNHEWLTEYQFGFLWSEWGTWGLWWWRNALVAAVFLFCAAAIRRSKATLPAAVMLLAFNAECLSQFVVFVRPQLSTFAAFAGTLYILRKFWDDGRWKPLLWLPLLTAIWTNLHGGFLAGLAIQATFVFGFALRSWQNPQDRKSGLQLLGVFIASILLTVANPYGLGLHQMLWHHLGTEQFVREWQPLWSVQQSFVYYVPFLLIVIALAGFRRFSWIDGLLLAAVGFQAVAHLRHVALLSITTMIILPGPLSESLTTIFRQLTRHWSARKRRPQRVCAVLFVVAILAGLQIHGSSKLWQHGIRPWDIAVETRSDVPGVPESAVSFLREQQVSGNLVTDYGWAQYVIWQLHPQIKVAFDGRYRTVYPAKLEREFAEFQRVGQSQPATTPILDDYDSEIVLLPNQRASLEYLQTRPDWVEVFRDQQSSIFVRNIPKFANLLKHEPGKSNGQPAGPLWKKFPEPAAHASRSRRDRGSRVLTAAAFEPLSSVKRQTDHEL